jgi:hypothetical protein
MTQMQADNKYRPTHREFMPTTLKEMSNAVSASVSGLQQCERATSDPFPFGLIECDWLDADAHASGLA